jgi:DNA processing protein
MMNYTKPSSHVTDIENKSSNFHVTDIKKNDSNSSMTYMEDKTSNSSMTRTGNKTSNSSITCIENKASNSYMTGIEDKNSEYKYELWLHSIKDFPTKLKIKLYEHFPSAMDIHQAKYKHLESLGFIDSEKIATLLRAQKDESFHRIFEQLEQESIRFIPWHSLDYPPALLEMADFPHGIFVLGSLPCPKKLSIAMVGARKCTAYGEHYALEYSKMLSQVGVQIISGLARGIDGISHRGALMAETPTFAVLGSGVNVCYPKQNKGLYQDILAKGGGIISEYLPDTEPLAFHFPMRNRIISGLSQVILIIEAKEKSGSLITADMALEQGKDIYALPGSVDSSYSKGCHYLIKQGAGILISPDELLKDLEVLSGGVFKEKNKEKQNPKQNCMKFNEIMLDYVQNMVYSLMCFNPKSVSQIVEEVNEPVEKVMNALVGLELEGFIKEVTKNYYVRSK